MKALNGTRIVDLTHTLSDPYGAMMLADLGAETIKVEPPKTGGATRRLLERDPANSLKGFGAFYLTLNRNKKCHAGFEIRKGIGNLLRTGENRRWG